MSSQITKVQVANTIIEIVNKYFGRKVNPWLIRTMENNANQKLTTLLGFLVDDFEARFDPKSSKFEFSSLKVEKYLQDLEAADA